MSFNDTYKACLATGHWTYLNAYYSDNSKEAIINMQLRYWVEAVNKFYKLDEEEYNEQTVQEGVMIINLLANSLLCLGGMNYSSGGHTPALCKLFAGVVWDLKTEDPQMFSKLEGLNEVYNNLSKHISISKVDMYNDLDYPKLKEYYEVTRDIWKWVMNKEGQTDTEGFFDEPMYMID